MKRAQPEQATAEQGLSPTKPTNNSKDTPSAPEADVSCCPICLDSSQKTLDALAYQGENCKKHPCCIPCWERILIPSDAGAPTVMCGNCPICQCGVNLFCLRYSRNGKFVYEQDMSQTSLAGSSYESSCYCKDVAAFHRPEKIVFPTEPGEPVLFYSSGSVSCVFGNCPGTFPFDLTMYHAASRTFFGTHIFMGGQNGNHSYRAITATLTFSYDMSFVTSGNFAWRIKEFESAEDLKRAFPLDGEWQREFFHENGQKSDLPHENCIVWLGLCTNEAWPRGTTMHMDPEEGVIVLLDPRNFPIRLSWDFRSFPMGPSIGQTLMEQHSSHAIDGLTVGWTRVTGPNEDNRYDTVLDEVGGLSSISFQRTSVSQEGLKPEPRHGPTHSASCLWGNTFVSEDLKVGVFSFHFVSPTESYISFENDSDDKICCWKSDHGGPFPRRVLIQDIVMPDSHSLSASVYWLRQLGRPFCEMLRWNFSLKFDSGFFCMMVMSSIVGARNNGSFERTKNLLGNRLALDFVNAALFDVFRKNLEPVATPPGGKENMKLPPKAVFPVTESNTFPEYGDQFDMTLPLPPHASPEAQPGAVTTFDNLQHRLKAEDVPDETIALVGRIWEAAQHSCRDNPIDCNMKE